MMNLSSLMMKMLRNNFYTELQISNAFQDSNLDYIINFAKSALGNDIKLEVSLVDSIPVTKMGKHRWVISSISTV